jgi:phosphate transport system permease protein
MMNKMKKNTVSSELGYVYSWLSAAIVASVCLLIIIDIIYLGHGALSLDFLIKEPNASAINTKAGGILTPMIGTVLLTVIGTIVAFPFSMATAIYLCFYSKRGLFNKAIKFAIDVLAGVPTIVVALFALSIFTRPEFSFLSTMVDGVEGSSKAYGKSFLVCGIVMAIMILPFVIKSMEEAFKAVPESYIEGSYALGATKWQTIVKIAIKAAIDGLVTGVILGMGRIIGDTAIVWLTLGGTLRMTGNQPWYEPQNWLSALQNTGSTLTSYIYFTSPAGEGNNYTVAFGASLILILIIILLNAITTVFNFMSKEMGKNDGKGFGKNKKR